MALEDLKITGKVEGAFGMGGQVFVEGEDRPISILDAIIDSIDPPRTKEIDVEEEAEEEIKKE